MTEKIVTYTAEQTATVLAQYAAGTTPKDIAAAVEKTERSVIAKLAREGVYVSPKASTTVVKRVTKATLIAQIAAHLGLQAAQLDTLEKASAPQLTDLAKAVENLKGTVDQMLLDAGEDPAACE